MANSKIEINDKGMDRIFSKNTGPTSHPASTSTMNELLIDGEDFMNGGEAYGRA